MSLDPNPARPLTSREIAKVVGAVLGGFVDWCGAQAVIDALEHLAEHKEGYKQNFKSIEYLVKMEKMIVPLGNNPPPLAEKE